MIKRNLILLAIDSFYTPDYGIMMTAIVISILPTEYVITFYAKTICFKYDSFF